MSIIFCIFAVEFKKQTTMTKDELYNQLLEKVQQAGGYVGFKQRPLLVSNYGDSMYIAAIFESCDDSSPLKVIDKDFIAFDLNDYFSENDISWLIDFVR